MIDLSANATISDCGHYRYSLGGHPRHPLYLRRDAGLRLYSRRIAA